MDSLISFHEWPFGPHSDESTAIIELQIHHYLTLVNLRPEDLEYLIRATESSMEERNTS